MDVEIKPEFLKLIGTVESDISKVVHEALELWLKQNLLTCPLTKSFCINPKGSCNDCHLARS
jgi:hypothetical protein